MAIYLFVCMQNPLTHVSVWFGSAGQLGNKKGKEKFRHVSKENSLERDSFLYYYLYSAFVCGLKMDRQVK